MQFILLDLKSIPDLTRCLLAVEEEAAPGSCSSCFVSPCLGGPYPVMVLVVPGFRSSPSEHGSLLPLPRALPAAVGVCVCTHSWHLQGGGMVDRPRAWFLAVEAARQKRSRTAAGLPFPLLGAYEDISRVYLPSDARHCSNQPHIHCQ